MKLTPEIIETNAEVIAAAFDGKPIELWCDFPTGGEYRLYQKSAVDLISDLRRGWTFRVPPAPKTRPWNRETCKIACEVEWKTRDGSKGQRTFVAACNDTGLWLGGAQSQISYEDALRDLIQRDGSPCGTEE